MTYEGDVRSGCLHGKGNATIQTRPISITAELHILDLRPALHILMNSDHYV